MTYPHLREAADLTNKVLETGSAPAEPFRQVAAQLSADKLQAPTTLYADIQAMIDALTDTAAKLTSGGTIRGDDLAGPADRYLKLCEAKPAPTKAPAPAPSKAAPPMPTFSKAESRYLKAYADQEDPEASPQAALRAGRRACREVGARESGYNRNRFLVNSSTDVELAVKYLCSRFYAAVEAGKRAIYEGDYAVGSEVRPGTYRTEPKTEDCYWERTSRGGDTIDNDFITFAARGVTVTIRSSDGGFSTSGCGPWIPTE